MMDIAVNDIGRQNTGSQNWFKSDAGTLGTLRSLAVRPDKGQIAFVGDSTGANPYGPGEQLWTATTSKEAPAAPDGFCNGYIGPDGGKFSSPVFSPTAGRWPGPRATASTSRRAEDLRRRRERPPRDPGRQGSRLVGRRRADGSSGGPAARRRRLARRRLARRRLDRGRLDRGRFDRRAAPRRRSRPSRSPRPSTRRRAPAPPAVARAARRGRRRRRPVSFACKRACSVSGKVVAPKALAKRLNLGSAPLASGTARRSAAGSVKLDLRLTAKGRAAAAKLRARSSPSA
jgi:hypothetical protein